MRIQYLGTGTAKGTPVASCSCSVCSIAREKGGKDARKGCSVLIEDDFLIDLTPHNQISDFIAGSEQRYILATTTGHEHFHAQTLQASLGASSSSGHLDIYGDAGLNNCFIQVPPSEQKKYVKERLVFHTLNLFKSVRIGMYMVTALPARHFRTAMVFLIEHAP